ncbi:hypothetical protein M427DRAFT_223663 [Gonapodya prolifera JEL478]|uniref:Uncharacterized protein n=1 Tax=Gonapodya prolifera (strain JEL478) TaxID=1344416 RepID=A0A139ANW7_GONPJ|nr:hypothetical protein M427DRAFT_223663 [Gonapodya prolifera JEL478]|eukprot:KXS18185.1 hypothetical protein M427DRAFT_223663 [Gonapodya prolifera JEL478]
MDGSEQSSSSVPISSPSKKASLPAGLKFKRRERTMEQISDDEAEGRPSRKGESEKIGNQEGSGNGNSHVTKKSKAEKRASSPPKKNAEKEKVDKGDKELKKSASQPLSALAARKEREKEEYHCWKSDEGEDWGLMSIIGKCFLSAHTINYRNSTRRSPQRLSRQPFPLLHWDLRKAQRS